jgi:nitrite reductase/ring-hydroxylating ferredoxin subunit
LGDKCPPVNQPLSFGKVGTDGTISDPVLGTKFSLKTGEVVQWCPSGIGKVLGGLFDPVGVPTYPVKAKGQTVEVQVDVNYKANFEADYWTGILDAQGKASGRYY